MDSGQPVVRHPGVVTTGDWILTLILLGVPLMNIILICLRAFGDGAPQNKKFALARLILTAIGIAIGVVVALAAWGIR